MTAPLASMGQGSGWWVSRWDPVVYMATGPGRCAPTSPDALPVVLGWARERARLYGISHVYVLSGFGLRRIATLHRPKPPL